MAHWYKASSLEDLEEGVPLAAHVADVDIALYRLAGDIHAVSNICPHKRDVKLSEGYFEGEVIECPMHQSCFNVISGKVLSPPACEDLTVYKVRIEGADIMIEI